MFFHRFVGEKKMSIYRERPAPQSPFAACFTLIFILLLAVIGVLAWWYWPWGGSGLNPSAQPLPVAARGDLSETEKANIEIYERTSLSLVQVTNLAAQGTLFGLDIQAVPEGVGSGFIWDQHGHIVTNYHVVRGADAARVTLSDHSSYQAQQIWAYPDEDIAVLWIKAPKSKLHPVQIGTSHDLKVGQVVYALGDPFGLDQTMTTGIVSALNRRIQSVNDRPINGAIQTSAPINPGNSGGPLLDSAGRLIGMNTSIVSPSGAFAGIGFAIPVDDINRVAPELIRHGKVVRPRLGVELAQDQVAERLGIDQGALVLRAVPDGPAAKAKLQGTRRDAQGHMQLGDVIVAIDRKTIKNSKDVYSVLGQHQPGDTITVTVLRDGARQDVQVTLEASQ
jgi:S1-C subfamily serine protease